MKQLASTRVTWQQLSTITNYTCRPAHLGVFPLQVELMLGDRHVPDRVGQSTGRHMPRVDLDLDTTSVLSLDRCRRRTTAADTNVISWMAVVLSTTTHKPTGWKWTKYQQRNVELTKRSNKYMTVESCFRIMHRSFQSLNSTLRAAVN